DELYPRPLPQTVGQHIEPCRIKRPHDDRGRDAGQFVGQGEQLPVSQMGGKDEDSTMLGHGILEVFYSDEGDPREYSLGWGGHRRAELDEHQTQMLERPRQTRRRSAGAISGKASPRFAMASRRRLASATNARLPIRR